MLVSSRTGLSGWAGSTMTISRSSADDAGELGDPASRPMRSLRTPAARSASVSGRSWIVVN
jgi:hypothetical protein